MGQEELASTVNISAIQAKRALAQLKEEGAIELKCGEIIIKNIEVSEKTYFGDTVYTGRAEGEYLAVIQHESNRLVYTKIVL